MIWKCKADVVLCMFVCVDQIPCFSPVSALCASFTTFTQTDMGGSNADITPEEVSERIFAMAHDGFFHDNNGKFLNTDRTEHPW